MLADGLITPELAEYSFYEDKLDLFREKNAHVVAPSAPALELSGRSLVEGFCGFSNRAGQWLTSGNMALLVRGCCFLFAGI